MDPYTYFEEVISGCVKCKTGFYTNGPQCLPFNFASMANCSAFHIYRNECIKCKSGFTLNQDGECGALFNNCMVANSASTACFICNPGYFE